MTNQHFGPDANQDQASLGKNKSSPVSPQAYYVPIQIPEPVNEIDLLELLSVLIKYKRVIAGVVFICVTISIVISVLSTPLYRSEVLLAPAGKDSNNKGGISALANQFGGLASLAGISVGGGGDIETTIATLMSRKFITQFISDLSLKPVLFEKQWDNSKSQWIVEDVSLFSKITGIGGPRSQKTLSEPSLGAAYKKFVGEILSVSQNKKTQLVTVNTEWVNPIQAADWANTLIKRLNEELRQKTIDEAERSISYLTEQINETSLSELQNVLYRLIEEHTKIITLAKVNDEYVLKVIDPAVPPEIRSKPDRKFIVILGLLLGVISGVIAAFFLNSLQNWRKLNLESK